jgi:hypothetical protein
VSQNVNSEYFNMSIGSRFSNTRTKYRSKGLRARDELAEILKIRGKRSKDKRQNS